MIDYSALAVEDDAEDFVSRRGRSSDSPIYPLFVQCLEDGRIRQISNLSLKADEGKLSDFTQIKKDCTAAAQRLKREYGDKGVIKASVKSDVVNGVGTVRFKAEWLEKYDTTVNVVQEPVRVLDEGVKPRRRTNSSE